MRGYVLTPRRQSVANAIYFKGLASVVRPTILAANSSGASTPDAVRSVHIVPYVLIRMVAERLFIVSAAPTIIVAAKIVMNIEGIKLR